MFLYKRHDKYYIFISKNKRISVDELLKCYESKQKLKVLNWDNLSNVIIPYLTSNNYDKKTVYNYELTIKKLKSVFKSIAPADLVNTDFEVYKQINNKNAVTLNIELKRAQSLLNILAELGLRDKIIIKKVKQPNPMPLALSSYEAELIINEASPVIKEYIIFDLNTGLRLRELTSLSLENVKHEYLEVMTKQNFKTKNDKYRKVPLNHKAKEVLHTILTNKISPDYLSRKFKSLTKKFHMNSKYNFHVIRKTFGTNMARSGINIFELSYIMGHSDIKTTKIYYQPSLKEAMKYIETI